MARVAFIVDDLFEDDELHESFRRLRAAGHQVLLVGREAKKKVTGIRHKEAAIIDLAIHEVSPEEFDALVIPGGYSPDRLRVDPAMVRFTREMFESGKPVAAICHAGSMLAEAGVLGGRVVTSWPSIKTDLINAGARWVDREVVEDGNLITSRRPSDLPAFSDAINRQLSGQVPDRIVAPGLAERHPSV